MDSDKTERRPRRRLLKAGAGLAVLSVAGLVAGVAYASIPDSAGVIHGCIVNNQVFLGPAKGTVRIIDADTDKCQPNETAIQWSQTGPAGAPGTPGAQGMPGPTGPQGATGQNAPDPTPNSIVIGTASVPGVQGSNPDGSFNLLSYGQGVSNSGTIGTPGGGGGVGKATASPFTFTKLVDKGTPQFAQLVFTGGHVKDVNITIPSPASKDATKYVLHEVSVASQQLGHNGTAAGQQSETISLIFQSITVNNGGSQFCFDLVQYKPC
jgi:type VI protein secretion system component Hcp